MSRRWLGLLAVLAAGCASPDRSTGGGGIEIPNGIEVAVRDSMGRPVAGARVLIVAGDAWVARLSAGMDPVLDSARSGSDGNVVLERPSEAVWVEVHGAPGSARLASRDGSPVHAVLSEPVALSGQLPAGMAIPQRLRLAGTSLTASVDAQGRFTFPEAAQGSYALVAESASRRSLVGDALLSPQGVERLRLVGDSSGILLDDFLDGDVDWALNGLFGPAYWWLNADVPLDSLVRVFGVSRAIEAIRTDASGKWLGVSVSKAALSPAWSNFGLDMGFHTGRLPHMGGLTAVRFRVRGSGSWDLRLATDSAGRDQTWKAPIVLDSVWTTVRIPVASLRDEFDAPRTLGRSYRLRNFVFQTQGEGKLDVDDIVLEGVALEDWIR